MGRIPGVKKVGTERPNFYGVRFRHPWRFREGSLRTPGWAARVAQSESVGAKVVTGRLKDSGNWKVQTVLIKRAPGKSKADARRLARRIVRRIVDGENKVTG